MSAKLMSGAARQGRGKLALYAGVGSQLVHYDVDVEGAALVKRAAVMLPAKVQYRVAPCLGAVPLRGIEQRRSRVGR